MEPKKSQERLQQSLERVTELLEKQRRVETLVHSQHHPASSPAGRQGLVESLVHRQHLTELRQHLGRLHAADIAYILEALPHDDRLRIWEQVAASRRGDVLVEASDPLRDFLVHAMGRSDLLAVIGQLDAEDLASIAEDLPDDVLQEHVRSLTAQDRRLLQTSLSYDEGSVGQLMTSELVTVSPEMTLAEAQQQLRAQGNLPSHNDKLFVVDRHHLLQGVLPLQQILLNEPDRRVGDIMATSVVTFTPDDDATEAGKAFERYDLVSAPVTDSRGRLLGRLTVDEVMDHLREETEEDVLALAGLSGGEDIYSPVMDSARNRWVWISLNMLTAFVASRVVGLFEHTIAHIVALASLMPIVAGIGGNTGNQTATLIIRSLALGRLAPSAISRLVRKELTIGLLNGLVWGSVVGAFALVLYRETGLALVIAGAMVLEMVLAAAVGMAVPLGLQRMGRDPALGTSVLLTASTDSLGFFVFLGLATLFLLH